MSAVQLQAPAGAMLSVCNCASVRVRGGVCHRYSMISGQAARLRKRQAAAIAGAKPERDQVPGVKLKTENKKPIVGLAVHPTGVHAAACAAGPLLAGSQVQPRQPSAQYPASLPVF